MSLTQGEVLHVRMRGPKKARVSKAAKDSSATSVAPLGSKDDLKLAITLSGSRGARGQGTDKVMTDLSIQLVGLSIVDAVRFRFTFEDF